jgi:hypothetical protein
MHKIVYLYKYLHIRYHLPSALLPEVIVLGRYVVMPYCSQASISGPL